MRVRTWLLVMAAASLGVSPTLHGAQEGGRPEFVVDHVGCIVDDSTFRAVAESEFLARSFAHVRAGGAATAAGASWENLSVLGELTYVEFLTEQAMESIGASEGDCMIALSTETEGGAAWLAGEMEVSHPASRPSVRLRELARGPNQIPWYHVVSFEYAGGRDGLDIWVKELHRDFKHRMAPEQYPEPGDISRRRDAQRAFHPDKLLRDITGVTIALAPDRRAQVERLLEVIGFDESDATEGVWRGPDLTIEIEAGRVEGLALRQIEFALNRPADHQVIDLGAGGQLLLGASAVWRLER